MLKHIEENNAISTDRSWEVLSSEYLWKRPWLTVRKEHVRLANGCEAPEFYVLEYPDWVNVTAITKNGEMVFIRQYRHGVHRTDFELCAGVIEEGEDSCEAAKRELLEETGFGGGEWTKLCSLAPNPSTQTNFTHCFLAIGVERLQEQQLDGGEDISVHLLKPEDVVNMLKNDRIIQALMVGPLWKYFVTYKKELL